MDKLRAMATFVAIVDEGTLTGAAASLGKALPTVVRSLAKLESTLGVRLLHRTTRRMSLTDEGRRYLERCRQILADVREAEGELAPHQGELRGRIRLTAPVLFGRLRVLPIVTDFLIRHPGIDVELLFVDRIVNLVEEGIDLGIRIAPLADSTMVAARIGTLRRMVVGSPDLLERVGTPTHPQDLRHLPVVRFANHRVSGQWRFVVDGKSVDVAVQSRLDYHQAAVGTEAAAAGIGFGRFQAYQVADDIASGRLVPVLERFETAPNPVQVVFPATRLLSARVRSLIEALKSGLADGWH